ncbi:MAG: hypothetical protein AAF656_01425 [Planctomycetota bacterium]
MPNTIDLDNELNDAMLSGGETPADVQAALDAELDAEMSAKPVGVVGRGGKAKAKPAARKPVQREVPEPTDRPTMNVNVEYVRSESTKMLNARIDEDLMTHLNLVSAVNKARKTGLPTVRSIIEQALVEWFDRNAPLPTREQNKAA